MNTLSRKEFLSYYRTEIEFANRPGIAISKGRMRELNQLFDIYDKTTTNQDFTAHVKQAGFVFY